MTDDKWVNAATADDSMVVELLLRLNQATPPPPKRDSSPALRLDWSVRQPRSKSIILKQTPARASPTTPLSWSGATSQSGGTGGAGPVEGSEESSRPAPGSKIAGTNETTTTKRSRKKKTITELKEEENLLLKERRHLKKELASVNASLEKQRATNERLKKMKLELPRQSAMERVSAFATQETISDQTPKKLAAASYPDPILLAPNVSVKNPDILPVFSLPNYCPEVQNEVTDDDKNNFVLPDLNVPLEEEQPSPEALHGMS